VLAGRHAGEGGKLPPAERGADRSEFLAHGAVVYLGMECAILADGVFEQQVEHRASGLIERSIAVYESARAGLIVGLDRGLGLVEQILERDATIRHEVWQYSNQRGWVKERKTKVLDRLILNTELNRWTWIWEPQLGGIQVAAQPLEVSYTIPKQGDPSTSHGWIPAP